MLSTEEKLNRVQHGWIILDMVAIGIYLLMMVEALSLFGKKKEEKYLLLTF